VQVDENAAAVIIIITTAEGRPNRTALQDRYSPSKKTRVSALSVRSYSHARPAQIKHW
jgi:hypothetical protein